MTPHNEEAKEDQNKERKIKIMNKPKTKQQLRRAFFALAIVGALLTLPKAQAQPIPATFNSTDCEHVISVQTVGRNTIITLERNCMRTDGTFEGARGWH